MNHFVKLFALSCCFFTQAALPEGLQKYAVDKAHTMVTFEVAHLLVSSVEGKFKSFDGSFDLDPQHFEKTSVEAEVEMNSVDTGVTKRDEHLKSPDFFDVSLYPKMVFKSTKVTNVDTSKNTFDLLGNLTIKNVTKEVIFHVKYRGSVKNKDKIIQALVAETTINRKEFNINFNKITESVPIVGDDVTIRITCEGKS